MDGIYVQATELAIKYAAAQARAERAEAELAAMRTPCVWTPTGSGWADSGFDTGCGAWYQKAVEEVADFCVHCGHPIEAVATPEAQP